MTPAPPPEFDAARQLLQPPQTGFFADPKKSRPGKRPVIGHKDASVFNNLCEWHGPVLTARQMRQVFNGDRVLPA